MEAIDIVRKIVEEGESFAEDGYGGGYCVYCLEDQGKEPSHADDCIFVLSQKMIADIDT